MQTDLLELMNRQHNRQVDNKLPKKLKCKSNNNYFFGVMNFTMI